MDTNIWFDWCGAKQLMFTFRKLGQPSELSGGSEDFRRHSTAWADYRRTAHKQQQHLVTTVDRIRWTVTPESAAALVCRSASSTPLSVHSAPSFRSRSWAARPSGSRLGEWRALTAAQSSRRAPRTSRWSHHGLCRQWPTAKFRSASVHHSRSKPSGRHLRWSHGTEKGSRSAERDAAPRQAPKMVCTCWWSGGVANKTTPAMNAPLRTLPAKSPAPATCLCCPLLTIKLHNLQIFIPTFETQVYMSFWIYDHLSVTHSLPSRRCYVARQRK